MAWIKDENKFLEYLTESTKHLADPYGYLQNKVKISVNFFIVQIVKFLLKS